MRNYFFDIEAKQMIQFVINSIFLGIGLAMDAFSVSMANGLHEPQMKKGKMCLIAGTYGVFQAVMPLTGWLCVHTIVVYFRIFEKFIPWIALILLVFIGGKMVLEGFREDPAESGGHNTSGLRMGELFLQGVATSIDALSVGFTIADYGFIMALVCALIIASVTFVVSTGGLMAGKRFGTRLSGRATILGGVILIVIGLEIFLSHFFRT